MLSEQALASFKRSLLTLQAELEELEETGEQAAGTVELDQASVGRLSRMDAMQAQQMALETQRRRQQKLQQIQAALRRIDDGEYGDCFICGEPINPKRLEIDPTQTRCIQCADRA